MIRTLIYLLLLSSAAHADTKRNWPRKSVGPATLIITMTGPTGKQHTFTEEFRYLVNCEERAESWREGPRKKGFSVEANCKKWLKIAPSN